MKNATRIPTGRFVLMLCGVVEVMLFAGKIEFVVNYSSLSSEPGW